MWSGTSRYTANRIGTRTDPWAIPQIKPCLNQSVEPLENPQRTWTRQCSCTVRKSEKVKKKNLTVVTVPTTVTKLIKGR